MATLSTSQVTQTGTNAAFSGYAAAASGGDKFQPGDNVYLAVLNLSAGSITVTVASPTACSHGSTHPVVVASIGTLTGRLIGPFPAQRFAGADGLVSVTYSDHTDVSVRPWRI